MLLSNPFIVDPRVYKEAKSLVDAGMRLQLFFGIEKKSITVKKLLMV